MYIVILTAQTDLGLISNVTILIICVYALNRNKHAELYTFQTSDTELLSPYIET